jgi:hypothetical protein
VLDDELGQADGMSDEVWEEHHQRQLRNSLQPRIVPAFTAAGFAKRRVPPALFGRLRRFYLRNRPMFYDRVAGLPHDQVRLVSVVCVGFNSELALANFDPLLLSYL